MGSATRVEILSGADPRTAWKITWAASDYTGRTIPMTTDFPAGLTSIRVREAATGERSLKARRVDASDVPVSTFPMAGAIFDYIPGPPEQIYGAVALTPLAIGGFAALSQSLPSGGTLFVEATTGNVSPPPAIQVAAGVDSGGVTTRTFVSHSTAGSGLIQAQMYSASVAQGSLGSTVMPASTRFRAAFAFATNDMRLATNGVLATPDTLGTYATMTRVVIGAIGNAGSPWNPTGGTIQRVAVFPSALTNAELQTLSAGL